MKVKFYADNFNDRRVWDWVNGEYTTESEKEILELTRVYHLRHEVIEPASFKEVAAPVETSKPIEKPKPVKKAKKKGFIKRLLTNG
jgi:hypothetical protein